MKTVKQTFDYKTIKTFNDACRKVGTSEKEFKEKFQKLGLSKDTLNYEKLKIIIKAMNDGWRPDWNNYNEYKYYPWFRVLSSGFGFDLSYCDSTDASVGSRLCFQSREKSDYTAQQFIKIYESYLM